MAAPTITATDVVIKIGENEYTCAAGDNAGEIVAHVPYLSPLSSVKLKMKASAASSFYISDAVGTQALCAVATGTAAYLDDGAASPTELTFSIGSAYGAQGYCFWITAAATTTIASDSEVGAYKIFVIDDLDKVVPRNSYSAALGALVTYDISKFTYVAGGIDIKAAKGALTVVGYNIIGGLIPYIDFETGKLVLYTAPGAEYDDSDLIYGQITVLKR